MKTYVRTFKGSDQIRLRIGPRRGTRGGTRVIDLDPAAAAIMVQQLGEAIAETVVRVRKS